MLTRRHGLSFLLLLSFVSDPDKHLRVWGGLQLVCCLVLFRLWGITVHLELSSCFTLPAPRCRGSWHHPWRGRPGSSPQVPPRSETSSKVCYEGHSNHQDYPFLSLWWKKNHVSKLTRKFPVLLEQAKSRGGWASILSLSLVEVRYSVFPPRAPQNWSVTMMHTHLINHKPGNNGLFYVNLLLLNAKPKT